MTRFHQRHGPPSTAGVRDEAWFDDLFRAHHRLVLAYARRRVPGHADDVVAEVFAAAWRRRDDVPADALSWLYRTAGNHVMHARRGDARRSRIAAAVAACEDAEPAAEDHGDRVAAELDSRAVIRGALGTLGEADQEVLRLWAWEQLDIARIAEVLECRTGTARVRLHRAMRRLRAASGTDDDAVPSDGPSRASGGAFEPREPARTKTFDAAIRSEA